MGELVGSRCRDGAAVIFFRGAVAANEKGGVNFSKTLDKVKRECYNMIREFF